MSLTTKSGKLVPTLFYGTAWKKAATISLVALALRSGFRAVDTACQRTQYREDLVGEGIAQASIPREDLFIQTKFALPSDQDPNFIPYDVNAPLEDQVRQSFAQSLQNLRTDYLDSVLLRSPARTVEETVTIINVLNEFKKKAQVRHLGISNIYSLSLVQQICFQLPPSTIQIIQNRFYLEMGYDVRLRKYCKDNGIMYQAFGTVVGNQNVLRSKTVKRVGERIRASEVVVFYRFCIQEGITVLCSPDKEEHMKEDLLVATEEQFALKHNEMIGIRTVLND